MTKNNSDNVSPTVIYIMGTGRSGSTMLEVLLSTDDEVCGVGELTHIFRDGFLGNNNCACGVPFSQCEFWNGVQKRLSYTPYKVVLSSALLNEIDWHKSFLKLIFHTISKERIVSYARTNIELYNACAHVAGKRIIVDSSKYPARALMLRRICGPSVKIICLTRSPEGILSAFQKTDIEQTAKTPLAASLYYIYVLLCCRIVSLIADNVHFISFEDMTSSPQETLKGIEIFTGVSFEETRKRLNEKVAFMPGHIVTGNRLKNNKSIYFKVMQITEKKAPKKYMLLLAVMNACRKILGFKKKS